jgi:hypothetical protein
MSEVISFRLNKENLREAKALLILQEWRAKGYSVRQTITEALLKLDQHEQNPESTALGELTETLSQVNHLLKLIESGNSSPVATHRGSRINGGLSESFVASVKRSAKSGLKIE